MTPTISLLTPTRPYLTDIFHKIESIKMFLLVPSLQFTAADANANTEEPAKNILGGYESNDDYTYVRGRGWYYTRFPYTLHVFRRVWLFANVKQSDLFTGRGRYVCDQCGIRCKKPSMLKKHIRTHSNDRPYTCSHCNFRFVFFLINFNIL